MRLATNLTIGCLLLMLTVALGSVPAMAQDEGVGAELVIATSVADREPVGEGTSFPADVGQLVAWSRITGAEGTTIEHVWRFPEGDIEVRVPLEIGGSPWRTWSTKTIPPEWAGDWIVEVRDAGGNVISSVNFTVGP